MKLKSFLLAFLLVTSGALLEGATQVMRWFESNVGGLFESIAEERSEFTELGDAALLEKARHQLAQHRAELPALQQRLGELKGKTVKALREERALQREAEAFERDLQGGRLLLTSTNGSVLRFGDRTYERTRVEEDVKRREARLASLEELLESKRGLRQQFEDSHDKLLAHVESWRTRLRAIQDRIDLAEVRLADARQKAELRDLLRTDLAFLTGNPLAMTLEDIEERVESVEHGVELGDESYLDYGPITDSFGAPASEDGEAGTKTAVGF